jgi:hypothetical protein
MPLGDTRQHTDAVMVNLLGDVWFDGDAAAPRDPDWSRVLAHPTAKLHLYGKHDARRGRKMGHVTCLGATLDDAMATASAVKRDLGIPGAVEPGRPELSRRRWMRTPGPPRARRTTVSGCTPARASCPARCARCTSPTSAPT